jgi:hypothetical protein
MRLDEGLSALVAITPHDLPERASFSCSERARAHAAARRTNHQPLTKTAAASFEPVRDLRCGLQQVTDPVTVAESDAWSRR